jgi:hypothetical protein
MCATGAIHIARGKRKHPTPNPRAPSATCRFASAAAASANATAPRAPAPRRLPTANDDRRWPAAEALLTPSPLTPSPLTLSLPRSLWPSNPWSPGGAWPIHSVCRNSSGSVAKAAAWAAAAHWAAAVAAASTGLGQRFVGGGTYKKAITCTRGTTVKGIKKRALHARPR